ncbi:MAG: hypothetical protein ACD_3C00100G0005 [uncultured bacterium (gcode 4)]|uniref:Uncharacterized protein n=1 Tax=uncultured bacterium (gcode 4) TaxID=1234023 RepID=K2GXH9_9BACT|nr:MAG: hypothetical protein ACD_3C00100G0005 [uncultured bacterium (gcode 4)]
MPQINFEEIKNILLKDEYLNNPYFRRRYILWFFWTNIELFNEKVNLDKEIFYWDFEDCRKNMVKYINERIEEDILKKKGK